MAVLVSLAEGERGSRYEARGDDAAGSEKSGKSSRRRDCHFDDTPCLSLLKHLLKVQGGAIKMTVSPTARQERPF